MVFMGLLLSLRKGPVTDAGQGYQPRTWQQSAFLMLGYDSSFIEHETKSTGTKRPTNLGSS